MKNRTAQIRALWLRLLDRLDAVLQAYVGVEYPKDAPSPDPERQVAKARSHWEQWVERRADARRDLLLIRHGAKLAESPDDEERAARRLLHCERMVRAARDAYDDAHDAARPALAR